MKSTRSISKRKPGRPKSGEPSNVKATLLRTASALFMEYGYDSVSMEQISASSGVTKASVYYYFPNKADLFTASIVHMMMMIEKWTTELLDAPGSFRERLTAVAAAHMKTPHVDFESLLREAGAFMSHEQINAVREAERSVHLLLASAFRREMEAGAIRQGNPLLFAYAFSSILMLGGRKPDNGQSPGSETAAFAPISPTDIVDLFWCGVGRMV